MSNLISNLTPATPVLRARNIGLIGGLIGRVLVGASLIGILIGWAFLGASLVGVVGW